jgi:hypothetical protein
VPLRRARDMRTSLVSPASPALLRQQALLLPHGQAVSVPLVSGGYLGLIVMLSEV